MALTVSLKLMRFILKGLAYSTSQDLTLCFGTGVTGQCRCWRILAQHKNINEVWICHGVRMRVGFDAPHNTPDPVSALL